MTQVVRKMIGTLMLAGCAAAGPSSGRTPSTTAPAAAPQVVRSGETKALAADAAVDLELEFALPYEGDASTEAYFGAAQWVELGGWPGPTKALEQTREGGGDGKFYDLRRGYGPPGTPPDQIYTAKDRHRLVPGAKPSLSVHACFIPRAQLAPEHLTRQTLDPDKMSGVPHDFASASVLVLERTCAALEKTRRTQQDFLRAPSLSQLVTFFPEPRRVVLRLIYRQPELEDQGVPPLRLESKPLVLEVP